MRQPQRGGGSGGGGSGGAYWLFDSSCVQEAKLLLERADHGMWPLACVLEEDTGRASPIVQKRLVSAISSHCRSWCVLGIPAEAR